MLSVFDTSSRISRRRMLTVGSLGLGALSLPGLFASRAKAAGNPVSGKSVIFVFQQGGPSQFETFDPKVDAPQGVRTITDTVQTSLPGVRFAEPMSQLARLANKLTVVRSFQTNNGGHNIQPLVGPDSLETNIGVHYARVAGSTRSSTGMPTQAVLYPRAVDEDVPGPSARGNLLATGTYGSGFVPFVPGAGGQLQENLKLNLARDRFFNDRRGLLAQLDGLNRQVDASGQIEAMDELQQQAYRLLLGGNVAKAFDLSLEDPATVARYDTSRYARKGRWDKAKRSPMYDAEAATIGKLLLLARRLCEAGCGFITVHAGYAGVWDMHADGNNLNMIDGMDAVGRSFDHAVAALVEDLAARGLTDQVLVVACGEMGRTPKLNTRGGRDHWARLAPLLLHGGGIAPGRVIGQSTRDGAEPDTESLTPRHLIATILQTLFNVDQLRVTSGVPQGVLQLSQNEPIPGLY